MGQLPEKVQVACPVCSGEQFEICALKDEGVATLKCLQCNCNFLLLDSKDHWFDVIQNGYPRLTKCGCKAVSFGLKCEYAFREDGDVRFIKVSTTCSACGKTKKLMNFEIDYSPTYHLAKHPLTPCTNPKILYDLQNLDLYCTGSDILEISEFLSSQLDCVLTCWKRDDDDLALSHVDLQELKDHLPQATEKRLPYLSLYAMKKSAGLPDVKVNTARREERFWKRNEVIRISSPIHMVFGSQTGLYFQINFSNEFIDGEKITKKTAEFQSLTKCFVDWLKNRFVSWRGVRCFDNPDENRRLFGDRFAKES
ncbi:MAG: hypothetical protein U0903_09715 [Planctomycetales bacterium]